MRNKQTSRVPRKNEEPHKRKETYTKKQKKKLRLTCTQITCQFRVHIPQAKKTESRGESKKKEKRKKQHSFSQRRSHTDPKPKFTHEFPINKIIERNKETKGPPPTSAKRRRQQQSFFFQKRLGEVLGNVDATKRK
jgi:hypothetical protein